MAFVKQTSIIRTLLWKIYTRFDHSSARNNHQPAKCLGLKEPAVISSHFYQPMAIIRRKFPKIVEMQIHEAEYSDLF